MSPTSSAKVATTKQVFAYGEPVTDVQGSTATSSELYVGVAWSANSGDTWTAGSGYTIRGTETDNTSHERYGSEDAVIASASTTAAKFTTTTSDQWAAVMASFKPATTTSSGGGSTATTTTRYVHTDNLTGSNIVTDASGTVVETLDYYPFGGTRLDNTSSYGGEKRKFAGHEYDSGTGLTYMDARYQNGTRGNFISEDPSFLDLGSPNLGNDVQQSTLLANPATVGLSTFAGAVNDNDPNRKILALSLADPQGLDSYSYVENNPVKYTDPNGNDPAIPLAMAIGAIALGVPEYFNQYNRTGDIFLDSQGRGNGTW
jgi:RHS repeat-associated protein